MKINLIASGIFVTVIIILNIQCSTSKMGKVKYGENGNIKSGSGVTRCDPPQKRYTKDLDVKVKASIDSLITTPVSNLDFSIQQKVIRLSDYSSEGLDQDLVLFRICQMANNRGFASEQTGRLIEKALTAWNSKKETTNIDVINLGLNTGVMAGIINLKEDEEIPLKDNFSIKINSFPKVRITKNPECVELKPKHGTWYNPSVAYPKSEDSLVKGSLESNIGFVGVKTLFSTGMNPVSKSVDTFIVYVLINPVNKDSPLFFSFSKMPSCFVFGELNNKDKLYFMEILNYETVIPFSSVPQSTP